MSKRIKNVRKSINQRKKMRGLNPKDTPSKQFLPSVPQEEEKHGYFPVFAENNTVQSKETGRKVSGIAIKGVLSVILFLGVSLLFQTEAEILSKPKDWTSNVLTEEFPFARVNMWYQDTFGAPMAVSSNESSENGNTQQLAFPVSGNVSQSFQANGTGVMIKPDGTAKVSVLRDGVVIFAGNDPETGKTVIVQHADNSKTIYGHLSAIDVHLYQFVDGNQKLGMFKPTEQNKTVYFAIEKNDNFVDPVQVIKVDDSP